MFKIRIQNNIATTYKKQNNDNETFKDMANRLQILRECLPPKHPEIAVMHSNIATRYYKKKNYSKALENYEKCHNIQMAVLPPKHVDITNTETYIKKITVLIQQQQEYEKVHKKVRKILNFLRFC